ncbi:MAG: hypothetical protein SVK08_09450 [Halobacteriota archaeon]|nr:hypothetical protein [Halobacteriota archaeon]
MAKAKLKLKKKSDSTPKRGISSNLLLPSGSTLLNCACSDNSDGAFRKGTIVNLIGDSSSGKSLLACSCLAEMHMSSKFDDYVLYYDDVEAGLQFDMSYLFGEDLEDRIHMRCTDTVEEFYQDLLNLIHSGEKFVYILDSLDALTIKEELKNANEIREKGDLSGGRSRAPKAKMLKEVIRVCVREIKKTESMVIIVSQIIDNMGPGYATKDRAGGNGLKHFCSLEIWLNHMGEITKTVNNKKRSIGNMTKAKVAKNRLTGKRREAPISIYYDYGVDDIRENVLYLVSECIFPKRKNTIIAEELGVEGTIDKLIKEIELNNKQDELQKLVGKTWLEIEESLKLGRKRKYA